jgi:hypothetical protein
MAVIEGLPDPSQVSSADAAARLAAAQAANLAYTTNTAPVLPVMGAGSVSGITQAEQADAAREAAKHAAAFHPAEYYGVNPASLGNVPLSQIASRYGTNFADTVQGYYTQNPTAEARAITKQYNAQHAIAENPFNPDSAAGIAWEVARTTGGAGNITESMKKTAGIESRASYGVDIFQGMSAVKGVSTVPTRLTGSGMIAGMPSTAQYITPGEDVYMAIGGYQGVRVPGAKVAIDYATGEFGVYAPRTPGSSAYSLIGGGGRYSAQSGMFSIGTSLWDKEHTFEQSQIGGMQPVSEEYMATHSKAGAEAYGGISRALNGNLLTPSEQISRYYGEGSSNLANFAAQVAGGKSEAPGANIPWGISASSPTMQYMNETGIVSGEVRSATGQTIGEILGSKNEGRLVGSKVMAGSPTYGTTEPGAAGSPVITQQPSYFSEVENWIKGAPILGAVYSFGQSIPSETKQQLQSFAQTTPGLESVYKGGTIFELKSDTERAVAEKTKAIEPLVTSYESGISAYSSDLGTYNIEKAGYESQLSVYEQRVAAYEKNKTQPEYTALLGLESGLKSKQASLETMQSALNIKYTGLEQQRTKLEAYQTDITKIQEPYAKAASEITGGIDQKGLVTYGLGSWFGGVATGYESTIEAPIKSAVSGWGIPGEFISGVADVPRQIAFMGQAGSIGGETIVRSLPTVPGIAAAGTAMQLKGTYEMATTKPAELAGSLAGMFILGSVAKAGVTKVTGAYRTAGMEYVPIERIGYGPEGRYPLNPAQSETALARSFAEGKLYPAPREMAEGGPVPYLHGEGGVPVARLPNAPAGQTTLWTALESSSRARGVGVGEAYVLRTSGGSEVQGLYGAPIVESYFAKVGGVIPRMVGFELPFRTPTIYSTAVEGVEAIPRTVRETARTGDYSQVNVYIQGRSAAVPSGQAYMPLLKPEYEAIVPDLSVIEITGRQYYTKLGGFGQSHFLGEKVPIIEQRSIGFQPEVTQPQPRIKNVGPTRTDYYSGNKPLINLAYSPSAVGINHAVSLNGESTRTTPTKPVAYSRAPSAAPSRVASYRTPQQVASYNKPSAKYSKESRAPSEVSRAYSGSASYLSASSIAPSAAPSYKPSESYRAYAPSGSSYSQPPVIPSYVPPYSPIPPSKYIPSQGPSSPGPSGGSGGPTPPPPVPPLPIPGGFAWPGGAVGGGGTRKRRAAFQETFMMGLDLSLRGRRTKAAKSFTTPKKYKRAAPAAKKKGGKK